APSPDSVVRLLPVADRAHLLDQLDRGLQRSADDPTGDHHLVDPDALRDGRVTLIRFRDLREDREPRPSPLPDFDLDDLARPGIDWDRFGWSLPDDRSYRDCLRSVFVLFAHQQKLG